MLRCTNRRDVLRANTVIFKEHGLSLNRVGKSSTKVPSDTATAAAFGPQGGSSL